MKRRSDPRKGGAEDPERIPTADARRDLKRGCTDSDVAEVSDNPEWTAEQFEVIKHFWAIGPGWETHRRRPEEGGGAISGADGAVPVAGEKPPIRIFIDADACPVKAEVYRVAGRHELPVYVVANSFMSVPRDPAIRLVVVAAGMDAADDWIAERAGARDIVVTADVPLASRAIRAGAQVVAPSGRPFTEASIGMALATRDLLERIRDSGEITGGPKPFSPRNRSDFLQALNQAVVRLKRER